MAALHTEGISNVIFIVKRSGGRREESFFALSLLTLKHRTSSLARTPLADEKVKFQLFLAPPLPKRKRIFPAAGESSEERKPHRDEREGS